MFGPSKPEGAEDGQYCIVDGIPESGPVDKSDFTTDGSIEIGSEEPPFVGTIDEVKVWKVKKPVEDIVEDMDKKPEGDEPNLIAYFPFDEIDEETGIVEDLSPEENDVPVD